MNKVKSGVNISEEEWMPSTQDMLEDLLSVACYNMISSEL